MTLMKPFCKHVLPRALAALVVGAILAKAQCALAIPPFWAQFEAKYVKKDATDEKQKAFAATLVETKCNVCHIKGKEKKERNAYGMELAKLLNKKDFSPERMKAEPDKANQEIQAALDKVAAMKSSFTFGELITVGALPGGDVPPAAVAQAAPAKAEPPKAEPPKTTPPKTEPAKPEPPKAEPPKPAPAKPEPPKTEPPKPAAPAPPPAPVVKHVATPAELEAIAKIIALGGSVRDIAQNDDSKDVDFHLGGTALTDAGLVNVKAIPNIVSLSLKDTQITDAGLINLEPLATLNRLHLEKTKVTDAGLAHLKGLTNLDYLNLYGTEVTDAGIEQLKGLTKLRKLIVWQTKVTDPGAAKLKEALPGVEVIK